MINRLDWVLGLRLGILSCVLLALTACGTSETPTKVKAAKVEFAGIADIRRSDANVESDLRIAALDAEDKVLSTGTLSNPSVAKSSLTISNSALATQSLTSDAVAVAAYEPTSVNAQVCGNIVAGNATDAITAVLTFDASGSMSSTDRGKLRKDAGELFIQRMRSQDKAAVGWFSSSRGTAPYSYLHLEQDFTDDKDLLNTAIANSTKVISGTRLWESVTDTINLLKTSNGANKIGLILSDGRDGTTTTQLDSIISAAKTNKVRLYTVGLSAGSDPNLSRIASETNGSYLPVDDASDLVGSFSGIFSGAQASGCITVTFSPAPPVGTSIQGELSFSVDDTALSTPFSVRF